MMSGRGSPHIVEFGTGAGTWVKSSRSGGAATSCVEIAMNAAAVSVRDSKARKQRLRFDRDHWAVFLATITS